MERVTKRLRLREFTIEDLDTTHGYAGNLECIEYMLWGPNTYEETMRFLLDVIANQSVSPRRKYDFALIDSQGRHIGGCGIYLDETFKKAEVGWILRKEEWNKGYGSEAAKELIHFGFEELGLDEITATCDARNQGSAKVMEKCGMILTKRRINHRRDRSREDLFHDQLEYSILK
ncbi:MAG: GNAT family N-acetyltransferase [Erysipelotrichaceae bacterium]